MGRARCVGMWFAARRPLVAAVGELRGVKVLASSWVLGCLVAGATWRLSFVPPSMGLDPSWWAGLYMAAHQGLHFGSQLIWQWGPLGFLGIPWLWYGDLSVVAFVYQAVLFVALSVSLVWALRRRLNAPLALLAAFLVLTFAQTADLPVALAGIWCLAAVSGQPPGLAERLVIFGGAVLGVTQTLIEVRPGPVILAMCLITLAAQDRWRRDLLLFIGTGLAATAALWFAAGQTVGNVPTFVRYSLQTVFGYSQAMGVQSVSRLYLVGELVILVLLVAAAGMAATGRRARVAAAGLTAVAAFSVYKEAAVRADLGHTAVFFGTAALLLVGLSYSRRRWLVLLGVAAITLINVQVNRESRLSASAYNPVHSVRQLGRQVQLLFDPQRRANLARFSLLVMTQQYALTPAILTLLRGKTVAVEPWEAAVAWTYRLRWHPLPVLQDYSAYTADLDRLDADALRSATAPQRILRENPPLVDSRVGATTIDGRFAGWDPPETYISMLCNYVPLVTVSRWQVLGKVPGRCGPPRLIASVHAGNASKISVPAPAAGTVVYGKIDGAGVRDLESIQALLYRARIRYAVVNRIQRYRLVPGTAGDGLLMRAAPGIDYPAPFALSPHARTIKIEGTSGEPRIDFYSMSVRATEPSPAHVRTRRPGRAIYG